MTTLRYYITPSVGFRLPLSFLADLPQVLNIDQREMEKKNTPMTRLGYYITPSVEFSFVFFFTLGVFGVCWFDCTMVFSRAVKR